MVALHTHDVRNIHTCTHARANANQVYSSVLCADHDSSNGESGRPHAYNMPVCALCVDRVSVSTASAHMCTVYAHRMQVLSGTLKSDFF